MIESHLQLLEDRGLIFKVQDEPLLEYLFRHALVQDATYDSLLRKDRRYLHRLVAESLVRLNPAHLDELAPHLGHHFDLAQDAEQALKYYTLAAEMAARRYANEEALDYYGRASALARESKAAGEQLTELHLSWGRVFEVSSQYAEALTVYQALQGIATERGDQSMQLAALMACATLFAVPTPLFNPKEAETLLAQALTLAHDLQNQEAEAQILWNLSMIHQFSGGEPQQVIFYGEQALAIARRLGLQERLAYILNDLAYAYRMDGQGAKALATHHEAIGLWQDLGNVPMLIDGHIGLSLTLFSDGALEEALAAAARAQELSASINQSWGLANSQLVVAPTYWEQGHPSRAIHIIEEMLSLAEAVNHRTMLIGGGAELGWMYGVLGDVERGLSLALGAGELAAGQFSPLEPWPLSIAVRLYLLQGNLSAAKELLVRTRQHFSTNFGLLFAPVGFLLATGEVALAEGDQQAALTAAEELLAFLNASGTQLYRADALLLKAQVLLEVGDEGQERAVLEEAQGVAETLGSRRTRWLILARLGQNAIRRGDETTARSLRQQARELVEAIAWEIDEPHLRASFLATPPVNELLMRC